MCKLAKTVQRDTLITSVFCQLTAITLLAHLYILPEICLANSNGLSAPFSSSLPFYRENGAPFSYTEATELISTNALDTNRQWRKLLHFETDFWARQEGQVDDSNFYLAPNGKASPHAELMATVKAFYEPAHDPLNFNLNQQPQCRFPARYMWWKKILEGYGIQSARVDCPLFDNFRRSIQGVSATLIFSSYYLNNPSSAFGHTFLRINKAPSTLDGKRFELLDYGINYAAVPTTSNALLFGIYGLFGKFPGIFTSVPYYYKVREYNDFESRDLWEYELSLNPEQIEMLVAHVWELGFHSIDYWYLTENCSYHMLSILEAAAPLLNLLGRLKTYVIPSDTTQIIWSTPELVRSVKFRPSLRRVFKTRADALTKPQRRKLEEILIERKIPIFSDSDINFSDREKAAILDAAIDGWDFINPDKTNNDIISRFRNGLLTERSQIDITSTPIHVPTPEKESPHLGHPSRRLGLGIASNELTLEHRFALHDQLDPTIGYPEYAQISFFDTQIGFDAKISEVHLNNFSAFEVRSRPTWSPLFRDRSWEIKIGAERISIPTCTRCLAAVIRGGSGIVFAQKDERMLFRLGLGMGAYSGTQFFGEKWMLELHPEIGLRVLLGDSLIFEATLKALTYGTHNSNQFSYTSLMDQMWTLQWNPSFISNTWGLRGSWHRVSNNSTIYSEMGIIQLFYYY